MKNWEKFVLLFIILYFFNINIQAQDIHFSQFYASTIQLNPALTGMYSGKYRFSGIYRNQWATVPVNYNTGKFSFETKAIQSNKIGSLNIGLSFYYDKTGDSKYTTILPNLFLGYSKSFGKSINHTISLAINAGMIYKQISYQALKFDAQYNGEFYDANAPSFENSGITKNIVFDAGAGIIYQLNKNNKWGIQIGYSIAHINQPNYSFLSNKNIQLNFRNTIHTKLGISFSKKTVGQLEALYQRQDSKQETVIGLMMKHQLSNNLKNSIQFYYGPYYRINDAVIAMIGIEYNALNVGFSYDINTSSFMRGTNTYGATEISFIYILSPIKKIRIDKSICPIF